MNITLGVDNNELEIFTDKTRIALSVNESGDTASINLNATEAEFLITALTLMRDDLETED